MVWGTGWYRPFWAENGGRWMGLVWMGWRSGAIEIMLLPTEI